MPAPAPPERSLGIAISPFSGLVLTGHAQQQMARRGIAVQEVVDALRNPHETGLPTQPGRVRIRHNQNLQAALDVVYQAHGNDMLVVTAMSVQLLLSRSLRRKQKRT